MSGGSYLAGTDDGFIPAAVGIGVEPATVAGGQFFRQIIGRAPQRGGEGGLITVSGGQSGQSLYTAGRIFILDQPAQLVIAEPGAVVTGIRCREQ